MRLAAELLQRGHGAVVFTRAPAVANPEAPQVPVVSVPAGTPVQIASQLLERIEEAGASCVILQYTARMWDSSRVGSLALPLLAATLRRRGLRVVLVAHELFTPWSPRPDLALGAAALRLQLAAVMSSCDPIFVTTETRRRSIEAAVGHIQHRPALRVLRVGANATPIAARGAPGRIRIGLFSTLAFGKRFDVVIGAFEEIARRHPEAELWVIGDLGRTGDRSFRALTTRIGASDGAAGIHLTGKLPLSEVARAVSTLDIYLFPMDTGANSRSGTLPLPFGAGVPVVAVRGAETDPIFEDRHNVLFAEAMDGPAFARAALEILADPALRDRLAAGGRRLYQRCLSWPTIADELLSSIA